MVRTLSASSAGSPRPGLGAGHRARPRAELWSVDSSAIDQQPRAPPLATQMREACRCCAPMTSSRTRVTVAASGRLYAGGRFCDSKVRATLMASTIARSERTNHGLLQTVRRLRIIGAPEPYTAATIRRSNRMAAAASLSPNWSPIDWIV